jgi:hypothetical protein
MPSLPAEIIVVLAPFAQLFSERVWVHAQVLVLGALLASPVKGWIFQDFAGSAVLCAASGVSHEEKWEERGNAQ